MKLIIGLGNHGKEYQNTRHNVGFMVLDRLAEHSELASVTGELKFHFKDEFNAEITEINREGEKLILAKPQTFMNASGDAVQKIAKYYKIEPKDIWVVADDLDLPLGTIRVRLDGTSGGHNGLESIIRSLSTEGFVRIRVGIGKPLDEDVKEQPELEAKDFVLGKFSVREQAIIRPVIEEVVNIIVNGLKSQDGLEAHTIEIK